MNKEQSLEELGSLFKPERERAVNAIVLFGEGITEELYPLFLNPNNHFTSTIIDVLSHFGETGVSTALTWFREYYKTYYSAFSKTHLHVCGDNPTSSYMINSLKKFLFNDRFFSLIHSHMYSLNTEAKKCREPGIIKLIDAVNVFDKRPSGDNPPAIWRFWSRMIFQISYDNKLQLDAWNARNQIEEVLHWAGQTPIEKFSEVYHVPFDVRQLFSDDELITMNYHSFWCLVFSLASQEKKMTRHANLSIEELQRMLGLQMGLSNLQRYSNDIKQASKNKQRDWRGEYNSANTPHQKFAILQDNVLSHGNTVTYDEYWRKAFRDSRHYYAECIDSGTPSQISAAQLDQTAFWLYPFANRTLFSYLDVARGDELQKHIAILDQIELLYNSSNSRWRSLLFNHMHYLFFESTYWTQSTTPYELDYINLIHRIGQPPDEVRELWKNALMQNPLWYTECDCNSNLRKNNKWFNSFYSLLIADDAICFDALKDIIDYCLSDSLYESSELYTAIELMVNSKLAEYRNEYLQYIGREWEGVCREIAHILFGDQTVRDVSGINLPNGGRPDIIIGPVFINPKRLSRASRLIECKKSFYFAYSLAPTVVDVNDTKETLSYLPYCDALEYWVLEEMTVSNLHPKITCKFAGDFIRSDTIPLETKQKIKLLLRLSQESSNEVVDNLSLKDKHQMLSDLHTLRLAMKKSNFQPISPLMRR